MKPIKIYGESKTGTTYLEYLLKKNTDAEVLESSDWGPLGWKHGFPQSGDALYIFIFRNAYEWARSLLADDIDKRFNGLELKFGPSGNSDHVWENPIKCRTAKYYSYIGYDRLAELNSLLVGYEFLRKFPYSIIDRIRYIDYEGNYDLVDRDNFQDIPNHTYKDIEGKDNPDRPELTEDQIAFIDSQTDKALESFVDNLTIE